MSDYTRGPWGTYRPKGFGADFIILTPGRVVATVHHYGNPDSSAANARLIAAAPELLDALQALVKWWIPECCSAEETMSFYSDRDKAELAIAKATRGGI